MRSDFDVYLSENTLTYVNEPCASADTEAMFFLALRPVDANDLTGRPVCGARGRRFQPPAGKGVPF